MIWKALRHTTFVELAAWAIVMLLVVLLSLVGVGATELGRLDNYTPLALILFVGLFLLIYRLRYGRL
jgi:hypothetical protein